MRILCIADAAQTGFGRVGRELASRFVEAGHDIRWIAINYRGRGGEIAAMFDNGADADAVKARLDELDSDPLTPRMVSAGLNREDGLGHQLTAPAVVGKLWTDWTAEAALVVADPRAMLFRLATDGGALSSIPTWNYVPIEGSGQPPFLRPMWEHVQPVAMSRFGQQQLEALLARPIPYIPHGVSEGFYPVSPEHPGSYRGKPIVSKDAAKAVMGLAGRTVILRTDRFVPRKDYPALFRSVMPVLERHPEAVLVIHCSLQDDGGLMPEMLSRVPGAHLIGNAWTHPQVKLTRAHDTFRGLSDADLNVLYNAADVYASPTQAEGFGLCLAEAAAAAVPVVTTDYAAGPEAVGDGALLARVRDTYTNVYSCEWALVDEADFTEKLAFLVEHPARAREMGANGRRHIARFTWDKAAQQFLDLFAQQFPT